MTPVSGVVASGATPVSGVVAPGATPVPGVVASGVTPVSGMVASEATPVFGVVAPDVTPVSGVVAPDVTPVSGVVASGVTPVPGVVASGATPVSGVVASDATPVSGVLASGVTPVSGVVVSGATPVPGVVASVKLAVVAAPIAPHVFIPGTDKDSSTRQSSLSHGDLDAQRDDFGSFQRNFKLKPFHVPPSSSKEPCAQTFKRRARPNARQRRTARRRQMTSDVDKAGLGLTSLVSDMDMGQSPQGVSKKRNRPNARQRRHRRAARSPVEDISFCAPRRVVICVASLQERLGLTTKDADFSAAWLTRDQFGMTFLDQLGLMDMGDLLALSKGLSKIGAKVFEGLWFKLRTSKSSFSFLDKHASGA